MLTAETMGWIIPLGMGAVVTLLLGLSSMALGLCLGLIGAISKLSRSGVARGISGFYTSVFRGVPELVTILIVYFGLQYVLGLIWGIWDARPPNIHPFVGGTLALGLVIGAYSTEVLRGAILSVPRGQIEACQAMGMRPSIIFRKVILPQAWRIALPGLGNLWLVLLKETALVSAISLDELLRTTQLVVNVTKQPFFYFSVACLMYLVLTAGSSWIQRRLEKRAMLGFEGTG